MRQAIEAAGWNIMNLSTADVRFDLFSDVPEHSPVPEISNAASLSVRHAEDDLDSSLRWLVGDDTQLAYFTKGRAAEHALAEALVQTPVRVLTPGMFATARRAFSQRGAVIETLETTGVDGSSDVDLTQLEERLVSGPTTFVCIEASNNGIGGWPISLKNVESLRELCTRHQALLLLDATRIFSNGAQQGEDVTNSAAALLRLVDAFWISCAKEFLIPFGALLGSRDASLIGRARAFAFEQGTKLEPAPHRRGLAKAAQYLQTHSNVVVERVELAKELAARLLETGAPVRTPAGGHGVFLGTDLESFELATALAYLAHLYLCSGIRAQVVAAGDGSPQLRLALPLATYRRSDLDELVGGINAFLSSRAQTQKLEMLPAQDSTHIYYRRFQPVGGSAN